jgi:hypothetical protein
MAKQGYEVVSQTVVPQHVGCVRAVLTLGLGAGKSTMVVTYRLRQLEQ